MKKLLLAGAVVCLADVGYDRLECIEAADSLAAPQDISDGKLGNLNWGNLPVSGPGCQTNSINTSSLKAELALTAQGDNLANLTRRLLNKAQSELTDAIPTADRIAIEGHVSTTPGYHNSTAAFNGISKILHFALCSRLGPPAFSNQCRQKAVNAISDWTQAYHPTGNPIDENNFCRLFQAIDLMRPLLLPGMDARVMAWMRSFITQGDAFYKARMQGHGTSKNNWNTWRLAIRGTAATVLNDGALIAETSQLIHQQIKDNLVNGASVDFAERDALHYHIYDMQAWVTLATLTPCLLDGDDTAAVEAGLNFLKPYYLGQKQHLEFAHSTAPFDAQRAAAGDATYQVHTWTPDGGGDAAMNKSLIRSARPAFSSIQSWTDSYVTPNYDLSVKFMAKLQGEEINCP